MSSRKNTCIGQAPEECNCLSGAFFMGGETMGRKTTKKHGIYIGLCLLMTGLPQARASVHDGAILDCNGCHSRQAPDSSSRCLACHAHEYRVLSENGDAYTPGGDFFWLGQNYLTGDYMSMGDMHGHNVIAAVQDLTQDGLQAEAPGIGGPSYQATWLACTSCHDPHLSRSGPGPGYRLLGGEGYDGGSKAEGFAFVNPAPVVKPSLSTFGDWVPESDTNHPVYISGMSEWCSNCHSGYLSDKHLSHPAGPMARLDDLYKTYRQSVEKIDSGTGRPAVYDFLVPIEWGEGSSGDAPDGPGPNANVMCLTCHRAHASAFQAIGRWDLKIKTGLADSPVLETPEGIHAYYGISITSRYGERKKTLCVLCHPQD